MPVVPTHMMSTAAIASHAGWSAATAASSVRIVVAHLRCTANASRRREPLAVAAWMEEGEGGR